MKTKIELKSTIWLELSEDEIGALDGIFGYSVESFLKVFYEKMGKAYVEPYEKGVRSLHERVRKITSPALSEIKSTRDKLNRILKQEESKLTK